MLQENEKLIRERVKALKDFYTNLVVYAAICLACIIIWLSTGGGFWPIWVIIGLAISAGFQGLRLGIFPMISVPHDYPK
jgi:fatty acid desaturase